ncbi:hypothetical protein D3C85_1632460 [compost metagenome]
MQANRGFLRINADRQVVGDQIQHVGADFLRIVAVIGQPLQVRDQHRLLMLLLQLNALAQGSDVVA